MSFGDWCRTLLANRLAVSWRHRRRAFRVTARSILNSYYRRRERREFGDTIDAMAVPAPLFVLGHWRSGTTLVHNLLACDPRFAAPTLYESLFPHHFLLTEDRRRGLVRLLAPSVPTTRGIDEIPMGLDLPNEDEFALAAASCCSPYFMWAFPRQEAFYERFLTFRGATAGEIRRWKTAFLRFAKKLILRHGRRIVLKAPPHTARVRLLLEMFPEARFLHVHRHPYVVFQSTRRLHEVMLAAGQFHKPPAGDSDQGIIRRYRAMHEAYFEERSLVPRGRLYELAFDDLERDPMGQMRQAYEALGLGGFELARPHFERHLAGLADYRKHVYGDLPAPTKQLLRAEWGPSFEAWGYATA